MEIESYDLVLDVDFRRAHIEGSVTANVANADASFALDAVDLDVKEVRVDGAPAGFNHDGKKGLLTVYGVPNGSSTIHVSFSKDVSDEVIFGVYKSKYGSDYMLVTDLEPAQARTVFPCLDHPEAKAVFRLTLTVERGLAAISNTPLASKEDIGGKTRFRFLPTPRMSTYLLFFGVGRFAEISKTAAGKDVIVAATPGNAGKGRFVLDVAASALAFYQDYFSVPYPLGKLHVVALPEYHTGAMENWGAITSREAYVLIGPKPSASAMQDAALVISHEISHQWFGDLVTMKWWDDLWLNESFATFMECKAVGALHPEWEPWSFFARTQTFRSQAIDALHTTHPIHVPVKSPEEASQVFDSISYGKGASVLRMIESYVGEDAFRRGVSAYLKRYSYSNATGKDLWQSIQEASGEEVSRVMSRWVTEPGFPLVEVGYSSGALKLTQRRFSFDGRESRSTWPVPLTYRANGKRKSLLLDKPEMRVPEPGLRTLTMNLEHAGYYSVLYTGRLRSMVAKGFSRMSNLEKGGFMKDLYLFLTAGLVEPGEYLRFVSLCATEANPLVVGTVTDQLGVLYSFANESAALRRAATNFAVSQAKRLGFSPRKGEPPNYTVARESLLTLLSRLDTPYTEKLASLYADYAHLDPNLKDSVVVAYARSSGAKAYNELENLAKTSASEVERGRIYGGLTAFAEPDLVRRALEFGISGEVSRSDSAYTMTRAAANPDARDVLWRWLRDRYDRLWEIYGGSQQLFLYYEGIIPRCAVGKAAEVKRFFSGDRMAGGNIAFKRIQESVEVRSRLRKRLLDAK